MQWFWKALPSPLLPSQTLPLRKPANNSSIPRWHLSPLLVASLCGFSSPLGPPENALLRLSLDSLIQPDLIYYTRVQKPFRWQLQW